MDVLDADGLFAAHRQGVFRYLCRLVGQVETAQDLTQEVFLRVSRAPAPDADTAGLRAWVFRIAHNLALNHLRDERRRPTLVGQATTADRSEPAVQELGVQLAQALGELQDVDRHVFLLREVAGLSYTEIATAAEISTHAVRARLYRARQELRAALSGPMDHYRREPVRIGRGDMT